MPFLKFYNSLVISAYILLNIYSPDIFCQTPDINENNTTINEKYEMYNMDHIYDENIKTVILKPKESDYIFPIIEFDSEQKLLLNFDELSSNRDDFIYKIEHCNANWQSSQISVFEYISGFEINRIDTYQKSFNTLISYYNYSLELPNNDVEFLKSGNYVLKVFKSNNENLVLFTRRFLLYENMVNIEGKVNRPKNAEFYNTGQEIDFTLFLNPEITANAYKYIKVVIMQNGNWGKKIDNLKPIYIKNHELIYDYDKENLFTAQNEFRQFNCKNTRFASDQIEQIEYQKPYFHFKLELDEPVIYKKYFYNADLNGSFKIDLENSSYPEQEADYVYVYFRLPYEIPFFNQDVFVIGGFNSWDYDNSNKMIYNYDKKEYQLKLLLKQGYYNYMYSLLDNENLTLDSELFEGNHYQTENDYMLMVYFINLSENYEQLIGYKRLNSKNAY